MNFSYKRTYTGEITAIIFDWAGTTVDFGCMAPAQVFTEIFSQKGVSITQAEAREPMGLQKRDHIAAIAAMPRVAKLWQEVHNQPISDADIDDMFHNFVPLQQEVVKNHANVIDGVKDLIEELKEAGIKIGSTTGYTSSIMEVVTPIAKEQGYEPDYLVTGDWKPAGRPAPWMLFENLRQLQVYPLESVIKVGDTLPDIEEGLNAGVWSVAVVDSSNEVGMTFEAWSGLTEQEKEAKRKPVREKFYRAGAHYVIDSLDELVEVIDDIEWELSNGKKP